MINIICHHLYAHSYDSKTSPEQLRRQEAVLALLFQYFPEWAYEKCPKARVYREVLELCKKYARLYKADIFSAVFTDSAHIVLSADEFNFKSLQEFKLLSYIGQCSRKVTIGKLHDSKKTSLHIRLPIEDMFFGYVEKFITSLKKIQNGNAKNDTKPDSKD